ncbi:putative vacuolar sorting protein 39 domain 1 [Golovinomyces cichoracearum]|uniref:Putative vacuolar sorting protein 39 domain 1 n=1 Tax=Golovinomyces cichoracearum TaxID=62708 RepID=A0A420IFE4_9PEZI|nr:putative vacuolar sorting protein 39 domain 1 [Golovinomyces cichoracearum]
MLSAFTARLIIELKPRDKSKIESVLAYSDRLLVGLNTGNLRIYRVKEPQTDENDDVVGTEQNATPAQSIDLLREVEKFSTRTIEQLAIIKESNILISLTNSYVSIHDLDTFSLLEQLTKTKGASTFATTSNIVKDVSTGIPEIVSRLAVCVKRKLLVWSWHESEMEQGVDEVTLAESIRTIQWASATTILCGLNSGFFLVDINTKSIGDVAGPSVMGGIANPSGGRFGGVGSASMGYIGLRGYNSKPLATKLADGKIFLTKDINSLLITCEGETVRRKQIPWQQVPEAIGYSYPYILALQSSSQSTLEVRNPDTFSLLQSLPVQNAKQLFFPPPTVSLTHAGKGFHVASERCVWRMGSIDYNSQINELVQNEEYDEAVSILNMLEDALLSDRAERLREIKIQKAQKLFDKKMYQNAIDIFMAQDVQAPPERVIRLFPRAIAGNMTSFEENIHDISTEYDDQTDLQSQDSKSVNDEYDEGIATNGGTTELSKSTIVAKIKRAHLKSFTDTSSIKSSKRLEIRDSNDSTSYTSYTSKKSDSILEGKELNNAVLALIGFLVQARNRMKAFIDSETGKIKPTEQSGQNGRLQFAYESLFTQSKSGTEKDHEERLRETATLIDTTLFRSYVFARPQLTGALFRIPNFCDPDVVNESLLKSGRYNDLVDFLYGKKLHRPALEFLKRFGNQNEDNTVPKALQGPQRTVSYLQNLPPEMIDLILEFAEWPLRVNSNLGMEIFVADTENSENLPRNKVLAFLHGIDEKLAVKYLEHLINELSDTNPEFHNRLMEAYLTELTSKKKEKINSENRKELMKKLIEFLKTSSQYSLGRAFYLIPKDDPDFYEAQAVVLSNMGEHKKALEIYVFKTRDYKTAEEYCNHVHQKFLKSKTPTNTSSGKLQSSGVQDTQDASLTIHHILLSLYLTPPPPFQPNLHFALLLLANHGSRLPALNTLSLIPDSFSVASLQSYLCGRIRAGNSKINECRIVAGLNKTEVISVQAHLLLGDRKASGPNNELLKGQSTVGCRSRRVVVGEDRVCPGCHKRLGNSVIAVTPYDTVVHYGCLKKGRGVLGNGSSAGVSS